MWSCMLWHFLNSVCDSALLCWFFYLSVFSRFSITKLDNLTSFAFVVTTFCQPLSGPFVRHSLQYSVPYSTHYIKQRFFSLTLHIDHLLHDFVISSCFVLFMLSLILPFFLPLYLHILLPGLLIFFYISTSICHLVLHLNLGNLHNAPFISP